MPSNLGHFHNSANYVPSQENRKKLLYTEHIIQALYLFAFCITPAIVKYFSDVSFTKISLINTRTATVLETVKMLQARPVLPAMRNAML